MSTKRCSASLATKAIDPGLDRLSLPLDFELGMPREHAVDLVLGVRRLTIDFPRGEAVDACAEHPRA